MNWRPVLSLCGRARLPAAFLRLARLRPPAWLTVLGYHRVAPWDPESPWDTNLISATPDAFREQMRFVRRHFSPVTSEQILAWRAGKFTMPRNPIVITFDDGYRDCCDVALPILRDECVPAEFFICPGNIEEGRPFWWDRITYCLKRSPQPCLRIDYPEDMELPLGDPVAVEAARLRLVRVVKYTRDLNLERFLTCIEAATIGEWDGQSAARELLMNWEQVRELRREGMGVGSHTYSHRVLPMEAADTVRRELVNSKAAIEAAIGEPVRTLAYPVGRFAEETKSLAREAGYELAYSYCSGASRLKDMDMMDVKRVPVERDMPPREFRAMAALPFLYSEPPAQPGGE